MIKPILSYAVTTTPSPLYTGEPGQIAVIVSNSTDEVIHLEQVFIVVSPGGSGEDLSRNLGAVAPLAASGWNLEPIGSGSFRATPQSGTSIPVGQNGFEFMLSNIPVNDIPGCTPVEIAETTIVDKEKRNASLTRKVLKSEAPLTLEGPTATPTSVNYGGESLIKWTATQGATITLKYDGKTINHVKGQPGTPLPAVGSFMIEDIIRAETVVTVNAALDAGAGNENRSGQVSISLNAPVIETLTTSRVAGAANTIAATWATQSAAQTDLTIGQNPTGHVAAKGSTQQQTSLFTTQVILSASNPVGSVNKPVTQPIVTTNWTRVADGPSLPPDCLPQLFSTGTQIGLYAVSKTSHIKTYISDDAQSWHLDSKAPVNHPTRFPSTILSTPDTTYIPEMQEQQTDYPSVAGNGFVLHRRDAATGDWTTSPVLDFTAAGGFYTISLAADDNGVLYALGLLTTPTNLYTSTDKGDSWTLLKDGSGSQLSGYCFGMTTLQWFGGKLWAIGNGPNSSRVHFAAYTPGAGWKPIAQNGNALQFVNPQSVVHGEDIYLLSSAMGKEAGGTTYPLQLYKLAGDAAISEFKPSSAVVTPPAAMFPTFGITNFKGIFFAAAGPTSLPGGGLWMFNQPDF